MIELTKLLSGSIALFWVVYLFAGNPPGMPGWLSTLGDVMFVASVPIQYIAFRHWYVRRTVPTKK